MILSIHRGKDNPILRQNSKEVSGIKTPEIQELILDMKETLDNVSGLGLAANQIGKNLRIFVVNLQAVKSVQKILKIPDVFINPKILKISREEELLDEGCLSLPGIWGQVSRHKKIEIEANGENNKKFKVKANGLLAQVFQHEMDHLEGILFIDKAEKILNEKGPTFDS